jgi:hypothetical protein
MAILLITKSLKHSDVRPFLQKTILSLREQVLVDGVRVGNVGIFGFV